MAAQAAVEAKVLVGERAVQLQAARDAQTAAQGDAVHATRQTMQVLGHAMTVEKAISRAGSPVIPGTPEPEHLSSMDQRFDAEAAAEWTKEVSAAESAIKEAVSLQAAAEEAARRLQDDADAKITAAEERTVARQSAEAAAVIQREGLESELSAHQQAETQLAKLTETVSTHLPPLRL